jgi:hypothetical protein
MHGITEFDGEKRQLIADGVDHRTAISNIF